MITIKPIQLSQLSQEERKEWIDKLYVIGEESIENINRELFESFISSNEKVKVDLSVVEDKEEELIGFIMTKVYMINLKGKTVYAYHFSMNINEENRGKKIFFKMWKKIFIDYAYNIFFKNCYVVSNVVNPISYYALARYCKHLVPRYDVPLKETDEIMIKKFCECIHKEIEKTPNGYKTKSGIAPKFTEKQLERIKNSQNPHIQFYINQRVDFINGEGFPIVYKATFLSTLTTFLNVVKKAVYK